MTQTTKRICLLAMGIALFVALSLCLQVPVFENYYLCLGYVVIAVYCYSFGVISGTVVGALGVVLYCLLINGMRGMPGWALGNVALGIVMGFAFRMSKRSKNKAFRAAVNIAGVAVDTALGILVVKSLTECLLYAQPFAVRSVEHLAPLRHFSDTSKLSAPRLLSCATASRTAPSWSNTSRNTLVPCPSGFRNSAIGSRPSALALK